MTAVYWLAGLALYLAFACAVGRRLRAMQPPEDD